MAITTSTGIPVPELPDENNPPADFLALASHLNTRTNARFESTGARDGAFPSPELGQEATVAGVKYIYRSGGWEPLVNLDHLGGALYGAVPTAAQRRDKTIYTNTSASSVGRFTVSTGFTVGLLMVQAWSLDASQNVGQITILRDFSTTSSITFVAYQRSNPSAHHVGGLHVGVFLRGA